MSRQERDDVTSSSEERWWEERLDRALATRPRVEVPADFSARVVAALPASQPRSLIRYSRVALMLCGALLMLALIVLMAGSAHEPRWLSSLLSIELAVIALGAGAWRRVLGWPA